MAAAAASSLLSGILVDGLDGLGVVSERPEGSDWFCACTVGANASQEVAKTRIESLVDACISSLRYTRCCHREFKNCDTGTRSLLWLCTKTLLSFSASGYASGLRQLCGVGTQTLPRYWTELDARFGSKADICTAPANVRFTPKSRRRPRFTMTA